VPSPAGGILCLLPLVLNLQFPDLVLPPAVAACHAVLVGTLMFSRIPTFAGKHMRIPHEWIPKFMLLATFVLVIFIIEPWLLVSLAGVVYLASIILSVRRWRQLKAQSMRRKAEAGPELPMDDAAQE